MKRLVLILFLMFVLCGCSSDKTIGEEETVNDFFVPKKTTESQNSIDTSVPTLTNTPTPIIDKDVEIISRWIDMSGEGTIEDYVAELNETEKDKKYKVYNEECYSFFIKESERIELLDKFLSDEAMQELLLQINDGYPNVYTKIQFNDDFTEVKIFANKEKYDESDLFVSFTPTFILALYSELVQSYELIPVEERRLDFCIIDNKTNEVIYTPTE